MTFIPHNINRGTSNVLLPAEVSQEIWGKVLEESAFMTLARRIRQEGHPPVQAGRHRAVLRGVRARQEGAV